jgi:hypothetical protein
MSVKIKIQDIELSPEEAREVYLELKQLFGEQEVRPYIPQIPQPGPYKPYWWQPIITC